MTEEQILEKSAESFRKQCLTFRQIHDIRTYQYGYLEATKELEQKLEQTEKDLADYQFNYPKIKELEKENAELKAQIEKMKKKLNEDDICIEDLELSNIDLQKELEQAKEIIKTFLQLRNAEVLDCCKDKECPCENPLCETINKQAEQFLREIDIDNAIQQANEGLNLDKIADEVKQDLNEGCPDILCENCSKEDCTVRKFGLVPTKEEIKEQM